MPKTVHIPAGTPVPPAPTAKNVQDAVDVAADTAAKVRAKRIEIRATLPKAEVKLHLEASDQEYINALEALQAARKVQGRFLNGGTEGQHVAVGPASEGEKVA